MAINTSRLFTTQGLIAGGLNEANTWRGTTNVTRAASLRTQFISSSVYDELVSPLESARDGVKSALDPWVGFLANNAVAALYDDVLADRSISNPNNDSIVAELVRQMGVAGTTVTECPSTITVAAIGSPTGDHQFVFTRYEGITGRISDYLIPDVYLIQETKDRSNGGTSFAETFSVVGKPRDASRTDAAYPTGSGVSFNITAKDPATDGGLVTDGGFNNWTGNTPTNWSIVSPSVAGTHIKKANSDPRTTGTSLDMIGDGSTFVKVRQQLTGITASTAYAVHYRVNKVNDPGTDWGVSVRLVDSSGTAVAGPNAYLNEVDTVTCASLAATWANPVTGTFVTPASLPAAGVFLEIFLHKFGDLTTAAVNLSEVYVDHVAVHAISPTQFYSAGPGLVVYSGITEGVVGDARTGTVALSSGAMADFLIRGMDRLIGLAGLSTRIPTTTSGSATYTNSLVT